MSAPTTGKRDNANALTPAAPVSRGLIRVVEVWSPNEQGDRLKLSSGIYGALTGFERCSQGLTFAPGDALPGMVWETKSPLVLPDLYSSQFRRADAARAAGLTSGIALPMLDCGGSLNSVVLLLCDERQGAQGAFEVWTRDSREELGLTSEYYANLERLESVSRLVKFPRGAGLPGRVWDEEFPMLIDRLSSAAGFSRSTTAGENSLDIAVGFPIARRLNEITAVVMILSSSAHPMARRFEIWTSDDGEFRCASAAGVGPLKGAVSRNLFDEIASQRRPVVRSLSDTSDGAEWILAFPVLVGGDLRAIVTLLN